MSTPVVGPTPTNNHETRIKELEGRVSELENFLNQIINGVEQAKNNPMLASIMRAMGIE